LKGNGMVISPINRTKNLNKYLLFVTIFDNV